MAEILAVTSERVDDIPLLVAQQKRMGLSDLLDEHFRGRATGKGSVRVGSAWAD